MEELAASPSFTYPSIHPPCEVEILYRRRIRPSGGGGGEDVDDDDHNYEDDVYSNINDSPLSSPPNSPYRLDLHSPYSEFIVDRSTATTTTPPKVATAAITLMMPLPTSSSNNGATAATGGATRCATPNREPAPFDETSSSAPPHPPQPYQRRSHALQLLKPELVLPATQMSRSSDSTEDTDFLKTEPKFLDHDNNPNPAEGPRHVQARASFGTVLPNLRARRLVVPLPPLSASSSQQHHNTHQQQSQSKMLPFEDEVGGEEEQREQHQQPISLKDEERPEGPDDEKDHVHASSMDNIEVVMAPTDEVLMAPMDAAGRSTNTSSNKNLLHFQRLHAVPPPPTSYEDVSSLDGDGACVIRRSGHTNKWNMNHTTTKNQEQPSPSPTTTLDATTTENDNETEEDEQEPPSLVGNHNPLSLLRRRGGGDAVNVVASSTTTPCDGERKNSVNLGSTRPVGALVAEESPPTRSMYCQLEVAPRISGPSATFQNDQVYSTSTLAGATIGNNSGKGTDNPQSRGVASRASTTKPPALQPYYVEIDETRISAEEMEKDDDEDDNIPLILSKGPRTTIHGIQKACRIRSSSSSNSSCRLPTTTATFNSSISMPLLDHDTVINNSSRSTSGSSKSTSVNKMQASVVTPDSNDYVNNINNNAGHGVQDSMIVPASATWEPFEDRFVNATTARDPSQDEHGNHRHNTKSGGTKISSTASPWWIRDEQLVANNPEDKKNNLQRPSSRGTTCLDKNRTSPTYDTTTLKTLPSSPSDEKWMSPPRRETLPGSAMDQFTPMNTRRENTAAAASTSSSSSGGGVAVSPKRMSIVGIATPPSVKRLNDSIETIGSVPDEKGGFDRHDINIDSAVTPIRAPAGVNGETNGSTRSSTSKRNLSVNSDESTASLIESLDALVRDMEGNALKVSPPSNPSTPTQGGKRADSVLPQRQPLKSPSNTSRTPQQGLIIGSDTVGGSFLVANPHALANDPFLSDSDSLSEAAKPVLVKPLDSEIGIPKGDVMLSLPNNASVEEAVWRCRTMRRNCDTRWLKEKAHRKPGLPSKGRTSILVDLDDGRVSGGIKSLVGIQNAAIEHLKYDDFDDALWLYEHVLQSYDAFFEQEFQQSAKKSPAHRQEDLKNYKLFVGMALHNLGIITLLKGEYHKAFTYFERATLNRASNPGTGHPDHIASLVKMALCHFALEDFTSARAELEEALSYLRGKKTSMAEHRLYAEVLNNLGCISYMCGQTSSAIVLLEESLEQQTDIADQSLYAGSRFSCHNGTLNASITKVNLGLLSLAMGDVSVATTAFETALRDQQLLLRDAHTTLLATIEYLVIANLVSGNKEKALLLLRRMLHMQIDAFGPNDPRCFATGGKITSLQIQDVKDSPSNLLKANGTNLIPAAIEVPEAQHTKGKFRPFSLIRRR